MNNFKYVCTNLINLNENLKKCLLKVKFKIFNAFQTIA